MLFLRSWACHICKINMVWQEMKGPPSLQSSRVYGARQCEPTNEVPSFVKPWGFQTRRAISSTLQVLWDKQKMRMQWQNGWKEAFPTMSKQSFFRSHWSTAPTGLRVLLKVLGPNNATNHKHIESKEHWQPLGDALSGTSVQCYVNFIIFPSALQIPALHMQMEGLSASSKDLNSLSYR